jgi:hypothetical protein
MTANPVVDQIEAVWNEVDRRCGANKRLIDDATIELVALAALGEREAIELSGPSSPFAPAVRVFAPAMGDDACDRCAASCRLDGHTAEVPMGSTIVQVRCCVVCVADLERTFGSVLWLPKS